MHNLINNPNQNNLVVGLEGLKGSGKTLILTLCLLYEYLVLKKKIYTNYDVYFPHTKIDINQMIELDINLQNTAIGISELHMICDSRLHRRKQNIQMSYFILQSRHRSVNFYYDTQMNSQVDVRIRNNTDINIICENLLMDSDGDGLNDLFKIIVQDKRKIPFEIYTKIIYGFPYFKMYNTDCIIDPFTMKEIEKLKRGK